MAGYAKLIKILEQSKDIIGDAEFLISDNMEEFVDKFSYSRFYVRGFEASYFPDSNEQVSLEIIWRDKKTGIIRKLVNGREVTESEEFPITIELENGGNVEIDIIGKELSADAWKKETIKMRRAESVQGQNSGFIDFEEFKGQMQFFKSALSDFNVDRYDDFEYDDPECNDFKKGTKERFARFLRKKQTRIIRNSEENEYYLEGLEDFFECDCTQASGQCGDGKLIRIIRSYIEVYGIGENDVKIWTEIIKALEKHSSPSIIQEGVGRY